jgi:hypothetical protein
VTIYAKRTMNSTIKNQGVLSNCVYFVNLPVRIGFRSANQHELQQETQCISSLCNGFAFFFPHVICDTEIATNLPKKKIICIIDIINIICIISIMNMTSIITNFRAYHCVQERLGLKKLLKLSSFFLGLRAEV